MTVEDRLRATTEAVDAAMRPVRPLPQLPPRPSRPAARERRPRRWRPVLVPLTAAAAVLAIAVALVAVRNLHTARPAGPAVTPSGATVTVPRYYVALTRCCEDPRQAVVGDSRTGRALATVSPPGGGSFAGVTAAADDRTFVLNASASSSPLTSARVWYLLRLTPGAARPYTLTRLPDPASADGIVMGLALAPDGRQLALLLQAANDITLRIESVATGQTLHAWTAPNKFAGYFSGEGENVLSLAWMPDGRDLTFALTPPAGASKPTAEDLRRLDVTSGGGDLFADSRIVLRLPWPSTTLCTSFLVTPDGGTAVCGATAQPGADGNRGCTQSEPEFASYSIATGKPARVLARHGGPCAEGTAIILWTAPSARTAVGLLWISRETAGQHDQSTDTLGLIAGGRFALLPSVPVTGSGAAQSGDIAF